jgi:RNA polymerase sigma-70 factor (ECF subfamily)
MYAENMYGVIYLIVKNRQDAEETCQDVFVKAWHNSHSMMPVRGDFLHGWLRLQEILQ